jgi:hypothetical protein
MDLVRLRPEVPSFSRRLNVTALQLVGVLTASLGTALVLYLVYRLDALAAPLPKVTLSLKVEGTRRTLPMRKAA